MTGRPRSDGDVVHRVRAHVELLDERDEADARDDADEEADDEVTDGLRNHGSVGNSPAAATTKLPVAAASNTKMSCSLPSSCR